MAQAQIEGTSIELALYMAQHPNQRFRLTALTSEDEAGHAPNEEVLAMLRDVGAMKAGMQATDGAETDRFLKEARAGAMYGDLPDA